MHVKMVIYVEEKSVPFVIENRQGKECMTDIRRISINELEYYRHFDRITDIMESPEFIKDHPLLKHPEGFSPLYNIVTNSKIALVHQAALRNIFETNHYFWLDMGYGHGGALYPQNRTWAPFNIMDGEDKITYIKLNTIESVESVWHIYKQLIRPCVNGAFFGGTKKAIESYYDLHKHTFEECLKHNIMDDDQTMAVFCYMLDSSLFRLIPGDWYDVFNLFY